MTPIPKTSSTSCIAPFENESQVIAMGSFQIENRLDRVSLTGDLDITKDKAGLEKAIALKALLDSVVQTLQKLHPPEHIQVVPTTVVKNPFN